MVYFEVYTVGGYNGSTTQFQENLEFKGATLLVAQKGHTKYGVNG